MSWEQDTACCEQGDTTSRFPLGQREGNRICPNDEDVENPLGPQDEGASPHPEVPGHRGERTHRRALGRCCALPPAYGLVVAVLVAVLVAVILALAIALAVQSAGRREGHLAPVLGCPDNWVGYRDVCYYLSTEEGSWVWSQERCSSHGASLAVLQREWEMEFLSRLKGKDDFWLGLRRQGERLEWVDGSSFTQTILVRGQGACLYLNDNALVSTSCSQQRPYMCSKHYAQR
ncbi:C-type lectin domain family 2 member B-like isoform X1 [Grus americana]|uniref:C-type lectin domain family 2 member B-like isoform X1 n=1 Tax=Grus americana TaxID=9117 RepID=UPI0024079D42|nr:C-type lectin domain family 2 member B-like isoform X1 [Grus americana]XP_054663600.1 C-type lectin domain family 2 member B-like isoform X1 [Grus americana]XP_054663601.1 C-type lectin domain family 2 member B-like isoform X1 [Grus americana]